jgi:tubulin-folding cofactor B
MFVNKNDGILRLNSTHSHTKTFLAEIIFYNSTKLCEVIYTLSKKYGTLPEFMTIKLIKKNGEERPLNNSHEDRTLYELGIENLDTIHVNDLNPNSALVKNDLDDVSSVKKYEISEVDYNKRNDTVRKFKQKLLNDPTYLSMIEKNQGNTYEEEASLIEVGSRCLLGDGFRRGEVKFVGIVKEIGYGFYVGIQLDEPTGENNGSVKGKKYFECDDKFGTFVRPNYIKCGDFPIEENIFDADEDEI